MTYHQTPYQVATDALLTEPLHSLLIAPRVIELLRIPGKNKICGCSSWYLEVQALLKVLRLDE